MIADCARVTLMDGTTKAAIDVYPGWEIVTIRHDRVRPIPIVEKLVENHDDVICLILSNGQRLVGSRDQRICRRNGKKMWFVQMADIDSGDELHGSINGVPTVVKVVGIMYYAKKEIRLVGFRFAKNDCFVVEGVLCR